VLLSLTPTKANSPMLRTLVAWSQWICLCTLVGTIIFNAESISAEMTLELQTREPAGVDRAGAVISGGVPLPEGRFPAEQTFSVETPAGKPLPCQIHPLVIDLITRCVGSSLTFRMM
ncbi:MAG: hypothetical protein ACODAD_14005, partial [Planctomycetota bacterium]